MSLDSPKDDFGDQSVTTTLTIEREGLYDVSVHKLLREDDLNPETVFQCEIAIPGTTYSVKEETMYFPGKGRTSLWRHKLDSALNVSFAVMYQVRASRSSQTTTVQLLLLVVTTSMLIVVS